MRITWVIHGSSAEPVGASVCARVLSDRLRRAGHGVDVLGLPRGARANAAAEVVRSLARSASFSPDIVLGDAECFAELAAAFIALRRLAQRVLFARHMPSWHRARDVRGLVALNVESTALACSDAVLTLSKATCARLAAERFCWNAAALGTPADRLARAERRSSAGDDDPTVRLLFVGAWRERKGLWVLLDAVERAQTPHLRLQLVGDATQEPEFARSVRTRIERSHRLRARVEVAGVLPDAALAHAMASSDALVAPATSPGGALAVAEALFQGTPVLATPVGPMAELVADGREALLAPAGSANGLAAIIDRFAADAPLRLAMGAAAEARAPTLARWSDVGQETIALLRGLMHGQPVAAA